MQLESCRVELTNNRNKTGNFEVTADACVCRDPRPGTGASTRSQWGAAAEDYAQNIEEQNENQEHENQENDHDEDDSNTFAHDVNEAPEKEQDLKESDAFAQGAMKNPQNEEDEEESATSAQNGNEITEMEIALHESNAFAQDAIKPTSKEQALDESSAFSDYEFKNQAGEQNLNDSDAFKNQSEEQIFNESDGFAQEALKNPSGQNFNESNAFIHDAFKNPSEEQDLDESDAFTQGAFKHLSIKQVGGDSEITMKEVAGDGDSIPDDDGNSDASELDEGDDGATKLGAEENDATGAGYDDLMKQVLGFGGDEEEQNAENDVALLQDNTPFDAGNDDAILPDAYEKETEDNAEGDAESALLNEGKGYMQNASENGISVEQNAADYVKIEHNYTESKQVIGEVNGIAIKAGGDLSLTQSTDDFDAIQQSFGRHDGTQGNSNLQAIQQAVGNHEATEDQTIEQIAIIQSGNKLSVIKEAMLAHDVKKQGTGEGDKIEKVAGAKARSNEVTDGKGQSNEVAGENRMVIFKRGK